MAIVAAALFLLGQQAIVGCANIIPPSGGPRDSLPPVLLQATPPDSTTNFSAQRIQLTFDEFIDLKDVQNNLLFTPLFENNPEVSVRAKTVTVRFRDSLEPNTTYILNFGNAIVDFNESNPLRDFTYTFSTGPAIDSLEISGRVQLAETGGVDTTMVVLLHRSLEDSAVVKQRPLYVVRLNRDGAFKFTNLPAGRFAMYALGNAGLSRRYQNPSQQLFAFADTAVVAGVTRDATLYAYREPARDKRTAPSGPDNRLSYAANLDNGRLELDSNLALRFPAPLKDFQPAAVFLRDSSLNATPFQVRLDSSRENVTVSANWLPGATYNLVLNREFAEDSNGRRLLKTDTLKFAVKNTDEYGSLKLRFRNLDASRNPVVLFVQNDQVKFSRPVSGGLVSLNRMKPGDYNLRILYDRNGNGQWDAGNFFNGRRQPEIVKPVDRSISIKAAWDNEIDISL